VSNVERFSTSVGEFIELWTTANEIAEESARAAREAVLACILPEPE
jgi:hypothetical protein